MRHKEPPSPLTFHLHVLLHLHELLLAGFLLLLLRVVVVHGGRDAGISDHLDLVRARLDGG